jgi:NitT/TauT family transport system substrate-binding protein
MRGLLTSRRQLLISSAGMIAAAKLAAPAIAQVRTRIRLGHLHVVAVDGHIWTGIDRGSFERQGIEFEATAYDTGPEVFEAMAAGKLDVLSAGGVIADYLPRGHGRLFLINDVEIATAQLWVRPDLDVKSFADLKGKRIVTTRRTTAHIFLDRALRANNLTPSDVEIVSMRMSDCVEQFITGEAPAVALWVPFNIKVRERLPGAVMLVDASAYYPQSAVLGGWVARADYYDANKEVLASIVRGWVDANDYMVRNGAAAAAALQKGHYPQVSLRDITESFRAQKLFSSREWKRLYADGTVVKWLQQASDFFTEEGNVQKPIPASEYFAPSLYLQTVA